MSSERRNEEGIALIFVLVAVLIIGAVAILMFRSAQFEVRATGQAAAQEAAVHAAEGGAEIVFGMLHDDSAFSTGTNALPFDNERAWVLGHSYDDVPTEAHFEIRDGLGYGIGPVEIDGKRYVYGVGLIGADLDNPISVRVIRAELTPTSGLFGAGILAGGDVTFLDGGSATINGNIHANNNLTINQNATVTRNATASGDYTEGHGNVNVSGTASGGNSPLDVPHVTALELHAEHADEVTWYDLCRDGNQGVVYENSPPGEPCDGDEVARVNSGPGASNRWNGWRFHAATNTWEQQNGHNPAAVFFGHHVDLEISNTHPHNTATFIASADGNEPDTGNIIAAASFNHHLVPWALMADRDVDGTQGGSKHIDGLIYAGEQFASDGSTKVTGAVIIRDDDHLPGTPVSSSTFGGGGSTEITFVDAYDIFQGGTVQVYSWAEIN